jgi:Ca2+-binding EF-hand superfamily protein
VKVYIKYIVYKYITLIYLFSIEKLDKLVNTLDADGTEEIEFDEFYKCKF